MRFLHFFLTVILFGSLIEINCMPATTTESLVVINSDNTNEPNVPVIKENASQENATVNQTDNIKPKITSMHIKSNVTMRYANTLITSRVINPAGKANEVTFSVVLPETAFISGFSMEIDGKVYDAYVKEKEEAKKEYDQAVSSGQTAAHVAVQARDSNHFTVSVNLEPESKAIFRLRYEELLIKKLGLYNLVVNLNPGQIVDKLSVDVDIVERSPISVLLVPNLRTGNEIDALSTDTDNPYSTKSISDDKLHANVNFSPNKEQQLELMKIFKEKKIKATTPSPFPFFPFDAKQEDSKEEGISGQFVVQYDVELELSGQVLVNDGYFVHFFAPKDLKPLRKHVIFVLDVSGSMLGRKINQLKEAMTSILDDLNPGDYFNIIEFSYSAKVYSLDDDKKHVNYKSSSQNYFYDEQEDATEPFDTVPPKAKLATPENIKRAKEIIKQLDASGGTNIHDALTIAFKVANYGIEAQKNALSDSTTNSTSQKLRQKPMIIFLTDGDPTVGETDPETIITAIKKANEMNTALFSLAFGEDADRNFLRKLSLQNLGFMRHIYEAADAVQQLQQFYRQVSSPLLADIKYVYPKDQVDEATITKCNFNHYFLGSELIVAGKLHDTKTLSEPIKVTGESESGAIDYIPIVINPEKRTSFWPMERLWAYLAIKQLIDEKDSKSGDELKTITKKGLDLALKYSFVTPLTSLVVVKPNASSAVNAEALPTSAADPVAHRVSFDPQQFKVSGGLSTFSKLGRPVGFAGVPIVQSAAAFGPPPPPSSPFRPVASIGPFPEAGTADRFDFEESDSLLDISGLSGGSGIALSTTRAPVSYTTTSTTTTASTTTTTTSTTSEKIAKSEKESDKIEKEQDTTEKESYATDTTDFTESTTIISTPSVNNLEKYGLSKYSWLEQFLSNEDNTISLPLQQNNTITLKLKPLSDKINKDEKQISCTNGIFGGEGSCQYLTNCSNLNEGFKDLPTFAKYFCDANGFAGICCDEKKI